MVRLSAILVALLSLLLLPAAALAQEDDAAAARVRFVPGETAIVVDPDGGDAANLLRSAPGTDPSTVIGSLPVGSALTILSYPFYAEGIVWYLVRSPWGQEGWTAERTSDVIFLRHPYELRAPLIPVRAGGVAAVVPNVAGQLEVYSANSLYAVVVGTLPEEGVVQILSLPRLEGGRVWWYVHGRSSGGPYTGPRGMIEGWATSGDNGTTLMRALRDPVPCAEGVPPTGNNSHILLSMEDSPPSTDSKQAYVIATDGLKVRSSPGLGGARIDALRYGETVDVASGQYTCRDGMVWWYLHSTERPWLQGWASEGSPGAWLMLPSYYRHE